MRHQSVLRIHYWLVLGATAVFVPVLWLMAHEGHEALPTRGAKPDLKAGTIFLSKEAREIIDLKTEEARIAPVSASTLGYASLIAPWTKHAMASSQLGGRIVKLHVEPGQTIAAGEIMAEVDSLELQTLRLELLNAQNNLQLSEKLVKETEEVSRNGAIPMQRFLELQSKLAQHQSDLELARSKWLSLQLSLDSLQKVLQGSTDPSLHYLPIVSPIAGTVIHADLTIGKIVDPNEHLFEIVDLSTIWVKVGVLERDLSQLEAGQSITLTLTAYPNEVFQTRIDAIGHYLDPATHLGTAWAKLQNPTGKESRFLPGMSGQVRLALSGSGKKLVVPSAAVIRDGAERYVFVEQEFTAKGSEYHKKSVFLGRQSGNYLEVRGGEILPGDRIVTQGAHELAYFFYKGVLRIGPETSKDIGLKVESAKSRQIEDVIELDAQVEVPVNQRSVVSSQLAGSLRRVLVTPGQKVKKGELIAEVTSFELQNAQIDLLRAHLETELLDKSLENLREAASALPQRRLWETEALRLAAINRRENASARLRTFGVPQAQIEMLTKDRRLILALPLRSPVDGFVVRFDKMLGHVVKVDEPLFEIHDLSTVRIEAFISERELSRTQIGQKCRIRLIASPETVATGTVVRSGQVIGDSSRTLSLWIELETPAFKTPLHGMLAKVALKTAEHQVPLAVPLGAVIRDGTKSFVFVQKKDSSFERRHITIGRSDDQYVEIVSGIKPTERIASQGVPALQTAYAAVR